MVFAFRLAKLNSLPLLLGYKFTSSSDCLNAKLSSMEKKMPNKASLFYHALMKGTEDSPSELATLWHVLVKGDDDVQQLWGSANLVAFESCTKFISTMEATLFRICILSLLYLCIYFLTAQEVYTRFCTAAKRKTGTFPRKSIWKKSGFLWPYCHFS